MKFKVIVKGGASLLAFTIATGQVPSAAQSAPPWMAPGLSADQRAERLNAQLTLDERISLVHGDLAIGLMGFKPPPAALGSAGFVAGAPRLGVPALQETDASLGVANPMGVRPGDGATPLPSSLALAASFDPQLAYASGAMVGREAWSKGFNVLLGGGVDLIRDPRNGRNFEYYSEDPLLSGTMAGESIRGSQDQHVISTAKHFAFNDQETGRFVLNVEIDEAAARESDLLAFELAIERGRPGAVMCAYNQVGSAYACDNDALLNQTLKHDWSYPGWVMSDWGAVHSVDAALHGLDQESGAQLDKQIYFGAPLRLAVESGRVPPARLADMSRRILRSMFAAGLFDHPPVRTPIDYTADAAVAEQAAREGVVLLLNRGDLLPLTTNAKSIVIIGGHADAGVLSGGGSSQVVPVGGPARSVPINVGFLGLESDMIFDGPSPLAAIKAAAPGAMVSFDDGRYREAAAQAAKRADIAIVFANQWMSEGSDAPDLSLPSGQDALIETVARANPHTIVVLQTGGPVRMPWLDQAGAVIEAWYSGARGAEAIADVLFGAVNPSGRLPVTFPIDETQLPRPKAPGADLPPGVPFNLGYDEGADVGYRWYAERNLKPLFPFGYGLSYTQFAYANPKVEGGRTLTVSFDIRNVGPRAGSDAPQVYLTTAPGRPGIRLIGWSRVTLQPGESRRVEVTADPRVLADFDTATHRWRLNGGVYQIAVGASSADFKLTGQARVGPRTLAP